jgi:hypothetical protein
MIIKMKRIVIFLLAFTNLKAASFLCLDTKPGSLGAVEIELASNDRRAAYFGKRRWVDLEFDTCPRQGEYVFLGTERTLDDVMITFNKSKLRAYKSNPSGKPWVYICTEIDPADFHHL